MILKFLKGREMRYITTGKIIDHNNNDCEYKLSGVRVRGTSEQMGIAGGSGYCLEIRDDDTEHKYVFTMVTEESILGSVAIKNCVFAEALLKDFTYIGDEEI